MQAERYFGTYARFNTLSKKDAAILLGADNPIGAIICYDSNLDQAFKPFIATTVQRLSDGVRPEIDLGEQGVEQVISSNGNWTPKQTVAFPPKEAGTVIMKSRRKMSEKLIEQGRKGNKGCYAVSWLFLLALVALALFSLKSCGAF